MPKRNIDDSKVIFSNRTFSYLDTGGLCWYLFKTENEKRIPSSRYINSINGEKCLEFLREHSTCLGSSMVVGDNQHEINNEKLSFKDIFMDNEKKYSDYIFLIENKFDSLNITEPIIIKIGRDSNNWECVGSSFDNNTLECVIKYLYDKFKKVIDYENNIFFGILVSDQDSISIKKMPIDDKFFKKINLELNYGKDFEKHHTNIVDKLENNTTGLFLFHGNAGTGKTTYIKYLAKIFGGKRTFIFIPTTFINTLTSPNIITILLEHPNSILVLEDAEKAIVSRDENFGNESLVSSLLNIGDGILGNILNLTIILTFNTSRDKVDKALLRKGRLHYEHKFDKLSINDSQNLIEHLNKKYTVSEPMSLAEIYNIDKDNNHKDETINKKIGFQF